MKLRYIYTLLTLIPLLYFAPAMAQTKPAAKKTVKKTAPKNSILIQVPKWVYLDERNR